MYSRFEECFGLFSSSSSSHHHGCCISHFNPADIIYNFWTSYGAVKGLTVPLDGDAVLEALY